MRRTTTTTAKNAWPAGVTALAGLGLGVAAMYFLDPHEGARRRRRVSDATREALDAFGETVAPAMSAVADAGSRAADSARDYLHATGRSVSQGLHWTGREISDRAACLNGSHRHHGSIALAPAAAGGAGLLVLGAAAAWLFDPDSGSARRDWLCEQAHSLLEDTGELLRRTGRKIASLFSGAERRMQPRRWDDRELESRVRTELGNVVRDTSRLTIIAEEGCVTLVGSVAADEVQSALTAARDVQGVRDVIDELRAAPTAT
jgi:hypothetical protein